MILTLWKAWKTPSNCVEFVVEVVVEVGVGVGAEVVAPVFIQVLHEVEELVAAVVHAAPPRVPLAFIVPWLLLWLHRASNGLLITTPLVDSSTQQQPAQSNCLRLQMRSARWKWLLLRYRQNMPPSLAASAGPRRRLC